MGLDVGVVEDVPIGRGGVIRPRTVTDAGRVVGLADRGYPGALYVMHAGGSTAPGSALSTLDGDATVAVGDMIGLPDGGTATVTWVQVAAKDALPDELWGTLEHPYGVAVVTCRPTSASPQRSPYNVVILARQQPMSAAVS
ncbi:hypothetical protein [Cellulomonas iranensis]|uniref:hypothetical protein n=1 Tax=Cellulomonas iranensis TaxID=76862 RepID=UPI0013D876E8|nr:hypothetical protein [Cellulomonas iranensis]